MRIDFSQLPLGELAFSERPMTFCDPAPKNFLSDIIDLVAIETGERKARDNWQAIQLHNLLMHASQRSAFWRQRIGTRRISDVAISSLPILDRSNVFKQVESEGSLLRPNDQIGVTTRATSGSSGVPTKFFVSEMNIRYNYIRSVAQYFLEGCDLSLNRVKFDFTPLLKKNGLQITKEKAWLKSLSPLIRSGTNKRIEYFHPNMNLLRKELEHGLTCH